MIGILGIACMDLMRVIGLVGIGGVLMAIQAPKYAVILALWTVLYLGIVFLLARRCVVLSKALSEEVSLVRSPHRKASTAGPIRGSE